MKRLFFAISMFLSGFTFAQSDSFSVQDMQNIVRLDSLYRTFTYQTGAVTIGKNLATINVPPGWLYLNPQQSKILMEDIYGNPPGDLTLGILLPDTPSLMKTPTWLVEYRYNEDGHVADDDANDINYDDLLKQMKEETDKESMERTKMGYQAMRLIGWAKKPFYDAVKKKLHWAKEYLFVGDDENTLNYNIRILGREGFLELNIISSMNDLNLVDKDVEKILNATNFNKGNTYADFDESTDKMAEYGLGGLIAGTVLAKTGILAKIGLFLLKFIKVIFVAVAAFFGFLFNRFRKKKDENQESQEEETDSNSTSENNEENNNS